MEYKIVTGSKLNTWIPNCNNAEKRCPTKEEILSYSPLLSIENVTGITYVDNQCVAERDISWYNNTKAVNVYCNNGITGRLYIDYITVYAGSNSDTMNEMGSWSMSGVANASTINSTLHLKGQSEVARDTLIICAGDLEGNREWYYKDNWWHTSYVKIASDEARIVWNTGISYNEWLTKTTYFYIRVDENT